MEKEIRIAYLCDGLAECSDRVGCFRHAKTIMDSCRHTEDPKHALNGAVDDPSKYPQRFNKLDSTCRLYDAYWEGDIDIPWFM